ncbi:unnamed protein product [Soboliphyme baturini]|uniref:Reverse transcriptase domain-containing protein n=1 Tax=Soboliphyme baturini TaxID=241478 RepID=A0A183IM89_9BILA|nr:unnamed protein product [Soboliphyme baturini]
MYISFLCLVFVDFEKAFDQVYISSLLDSLKSQGIENRSILLIAEIFKTAIASMMLYKGKTEVIIDKIVRQLCAVSPKAFAAALGEVFRALR